MKRGVVNFFFFMESYHNYHKEYLECLLKSNSRSN